MVEHSWSYGLTKDAEKIRYEVFTLEQGFAPEIDVDEIDERAWHIVVYVDKIPVGTGRIFFDHDDVYHLGRLAVISNYRKMNLGRFLVNNLLQKAKELGANKVILGAQIDKIPFYKKLGFIEDPIGNIFLDGGAPHMMMSIDLD